MTKVLIFGATGQVGYELRQPLAGSSSVFSLENAKTNFIDTYEIRKTIQECRPDIIINAAAFTAVDRAEQDRETAFAINCRAVEVIAAETRNLNAWLIHYSTDYVFDGMKKTPYFEDDYRAPVNYYGVTKHGGELAIERSGCRYLIFRTSWVYSDRRNNFVKTMLSLFQQKKQLFVVNDQHGTPTSAKFIASVTEHCLMRLANRGLDKSALRGVYHLVPDGQTTWYGLAKYLWDYAIERFDNIKTEQITPITTSDYPMKATRPLYSVLDNQKIQKIFSLDFDHWMIYVDQILTDIKKGILA